MSYRHKQSAVATNLVALLPTFAMACAVVLIATVAPKVACSDTLGEGLYPLLFQTISGLAVSVTDRATITLSRVNPQTNVRELVQVSQRNAMGFDASTIERFLSEQLSCVIALEDSGVTYADCRMLIRENGENTRLDVLRQLLTNAPELVGCSEVEREAFRENGQEECVVNGAE